MPTHVFIPLEHRLVAFDVYPHRTVASPVNLNKMKKSAYHSDLALLSFFPALCEEG